MVGRQASCGDLAERGGETFTIISNYPLSSGHLVCRILCRCLFVGVGFFPRHYSLKENSLFFERVVFQSTCKPRYLEDSP